MSVQHTSILWEQQIRELFANGEKTEGKRLLNQLIAEAVRQRRFEDADKLRDFLVEIDPMALSEIIRTAEVIENAKIAAIDKTFLASWSSLLKFLDPDEISTLYHSLAHYSIPAGHLIVRQGAQQSALYFINSGKVDLFFQQNGEIVPYKAIGPGEFLGAGTFFEASVWTINARSLGAGVSSLKSEKVQRWQIDFPGLESKLNDFCNRCKILPEYFNKMGRDRRMFERLPISGKIEMALLDREGKETMSGARGEFFDISVGGLSFYLRISKKSNARELLGRKVGLAITSKSFSRSMIIGAVVAVRSQPVVGNEYAVSVKFNRVLAQTELRDLVASARDNKLKKKWR